MSLFKTKGIILKKTINNKNEVFTLFSYDFGKIIFSKKINKKEKNIDIGNIINLEIKTSENSEIHKGQNIKIKAEIDYINLNYNNIINYLDLISFINKNTPKNLPIPEIFNIYKLTLDNYKNINNIKIILSKLKILNILGELNLEHDNITIKKILNFINKNNFNKIILLTGINSELELLLSKIITGKN